MATDPRDIEPGESVWMAFIDMHIVNHNGNMIDACSLAATAALRTCIVPASQHDLGDDYPLPVTCTPVASTFIKLGNSLMVDPCQDEEHVAEARLTMTFDEKGELRAMQKSYNGAFTQDEISKICDMALKNSQEMRKHISK